MIFLDQAGPKFVMFEDDPVKKTLSGETRKLGSIRYTLSSELEVLLCLIFDD